MDIAEKRVYETSEGRTRLAVATEQGLAVVGVSADVIGEFGLALAEPATDVAAIGDGRVLVATPTALRLVTLAESGVAATVATAATGAGPTLAVTIADDAVLAAGADGVVRRASTSAVLAATADEADDRDVAAPEWTDLGEATVRAADGRLLAAADGVYRADEGLIERVGLDDVRGVAAAGPFAATGEGCFRLGPGWTEERSGAFDLVAAAGQPSPDRDVAHLATGEELFEREDGEWQSIEWPARSAVAGIGYADAGESADVVRYGVATDGTVCVDAGDGWRTRSIGLRGVAGCAVVR